MSAKNFLAEFKARGFFYQCTDEEALQKKLSSNEIISAYIGFDCTAKSLHVGNLMQLMIFRLMQKHGLKPIVLIGGATTRIGDPSGKDEARKMLTDQEIQENIDGIRASISKFINFSDEPLGAILVNNSDWLSSIGYIEMLKLVGSHFSVNRMLSFDSVRLRLEREQPLSFLEFNYMILQSYDYYFLNKNYNCFIQCGGSDQWGNIVSGADLIRRLSGKEAFGLTTPLITTASGQKMGKSANGAVWLNSNMLSSYDYFQFWRNCEDLDLFKFMRLYTDLTLEQIAEYEADKSANINEFKKILAYEATKLCHGEAEAKKALQTAINVFEKNIAQGMEEYKISKQDVGVMRIYEIIAKSGLASSNSEAKRLIKGGGVKINSVKLEAEDELISMDMFTQDGYVVLSVGKKNHKKIVYS